MINASNMKVFETYKCFKPHNHFFELWEDSDEPLLFVGGVASPGLPNVLIVWTNFPWVAMTWT